MLLMPSLWCVILFGNRYRYRCSPMRWEENVQLSNWGKSLTVYVFFWDRPSTIHGPNTIGLFVFPFC